MILKVIEQATGMARRRVQFSIAMCCTGSARAPSPDVTLGGLSSAPYPQSFLSKALPLPHMERGVSGAHYL